MPFSTQMIDEFDHPKSNLLSRVRPGCSPAAKNISLQKTLCSVCLYSTRR